MTARCANRERHAIRPDFIAGLLESIHVRIPPEDPEGRLLAAQLMSVMEHRSIEQDVMEFLKNIMRNRSVETSFVYDKNRPLGISGSGYAGAGLKILWS